MVRSNSVPKLSRSCRAVIGFLATASMLATACVASSGAGAASTKGSYKLMVIAPLTSSPAFPDSFPELLTGAQAAAKQINAAGGVNGKTITIVACDSKGDANAATNCAQQAVNQKLPGVVGALDNAGNYATTLKSALLPNIAPYASLPVLENSDAYPLYGGQLSYLGGMVSILAKRGIKSVSVSYVNQTGLGAQLQALLGISAKYFPGLKVSYIPISPTQGDYSPIVATANQNSGFVMATDAPTLVHFLQTAKQQGVKKPTSISSVILLQGNTVKQLGPLATSLYSPGGFLPAADTSSKAVVKFNAAMNAVNKKASKDDFSEDAYLGVELFADVAKGMKNVTGPAVAAKLDQLDGLSLGLLPPIQFTTPDKSFGPLDRIFNPDVVYMQINKAGKALPTTGSFVNAFSGANPTKP